MFDVDPGTEAGGQTSVTVTHYHAASDGDYTELETFALVRPPFGPAALAGPREPRPGSPVIPRVIITTPEPVRR